MIVNVLASTVRSAGRRGTRVFDDGICKSDESQTAGFNGTIFMLPERQTGRHRRDEFTFDREAHCERIAGHSIRTRAHRSVIYNCAPRVLTANTGARVVALVSQANPVQRTIRVLHAFGSTRGIRIAVILGQAGAHPIATLRVRSAWRRIARILRHRYGWKRHYYVLSESFLSGEKR